MRICCCDFMAKDKNNFYVNCQNSYNINSNSLIIEIQEFLNIKKFYTLNQFLDMIIYFKFIRFYESVNIADINNYHGT